MAYDSPQRTGVIQAAERRFRDLVHGVDAIVWEADAVSLACTFVSQRAEELLGYPIERWLGSTDIWTEIIDPRDRDRVLSRYVEALTSDRPLEHEFRAKTVDGRQVWLRDRVHPAERGRLRGLMIDVTEHKRLEQERDELLLREQVARNEMESAAEMVQRLERITEAALTDLSQERLLRRVLERIRDVLEADTALILLPTEDGEYLRVVGAVGLEAEDDVRVPMATSLCGRIATTRRALLVEDATRADVDLPALRRAQVRSLIGVPLSVDGRMIGVVHAARVARRRFSADDARLLQLVGDRLGVAIRNVRLYEAERRARLALEAAARRAAFLADAVTALAAATDPADGLRAVARLAVPLLADWCAVDLRDPDGGFRRVAVVHRDPAAEARAAVLLGPVAAPTSVGVTRALETGASEWVSADAEAADLVVRGEPDERLAVAGLGVEGYVIAPLAVGGRVLGAITLVAAPGRGLGESEVRLAQDLARRAALALDAERRRGLTRELLQMVGGELRAPLASLGRALRATTDPAKAGAVRTAARALSAVAREARVAARFVAVTPDANARRVDLAHLVDAAVNAVADEARAKGVDVESAVEPDTVEVTGDRRRLRQAAQRLLETAVRSTPAGGRVRARLSRAGAHAVLAVSMVGASVAPTVGLRLSVARQVVECHGGTLTTVSEGAGPTLTVSLPLADSIASTRAPLS
ncbi:MAG TPA: GAF domain-containing protein [Methylomirabilota bacterium]|jgi:PAS domain S-box-containing protein